MQQVVNASSRLCLMILFLILAFQLSMGQQNPNVDNTVGLVPEGWTPPAAPAVIEAITSEEGFDNFYLGIDFSEPHISSNPLNPLEYFTAFNINGAHYTHNGHDWTAIAPPFGVSPNGDPVTAYDSLGNLYYETMYGGIVGCKVIRSTDNGVTWSAAVTSISGFDKNWIACDQTAGPYANYVYTTMTASGGGNFARSTDFGATWQNTWNFSTQSAPGMMVAVGPNVMGGNNISGGCVYVVTNGGSATGHIYTFYVSTDGGQTFTLKSTQSFANYVGTFVNGRNSVENMRVRPYPFITADNSFGPYRGRLYLVYTANNPPGNGNKPEIFCRYSDDQGATWTPEIIVNDDPNSANNHQFHPAPWCDKETGRLYVKWFDTRNVPTSDSAEVYASYSDDGGDTWAPNQNLSTDKFKIDCASCGGGGTPRYQGDYDAITSNRYSAMTVWSDFRDGTFGSYVAYFPDFAMLVSTPADTIGTTDSADVIIKVPAVKLYEHSVKFSAEVSPAANFTFTFPEGDTLTSYPDSLTMRIHTNGADLGDYTVTITGEGPNGTPVHKRTVELTVLGSFVGLQQPNGGEQIYGNARYLIKWIVNQVDSVKIDYSDDGGDTWNVITEGVPGNNSGIIHPKLFVKPKSLEGMATENGVFSWEVPGILSDSCLVRIIAKEDSTLIDISDSFFSIIPPPQGRWKMNTAATNESFFSVSVVDTLIAWAAGSNGRIYRTTNGGNTWLQRLPVFNDVYNIFAMNEVLAFIASNAAGNARIFRTATGGTSWQTVYADTNSSAFINTIKLFDENNGYAVGDPVNGQWTLLKTTDGGATWEVAATLPQAGSEAGWNNSMDWVGDQYGWFGTDNSRVYYTTDGGSSWNSANTSFSNSYAVSFATELLGMASGTGTDRSFDGGASWSASPGQLPGDVFASAALDLDPPRWYMVSGSEIHKTTDHGENFSLDYTLPNTLQHIDMKVVNLEGNDWIVGYAVGDQGTITRYIELITLTGIDDQKSAILGVFSLKQNYPNPFNPTTTVAYTLPERAKVTLKIVNLLGQEVRTLINTTQNAGAYDVTWDGRSNTGVPVASGVYFYKLEAKAQDGEMYTDSRKMLLLK